MKVEINSNRPIYEIIDELVLQVLKVKKEGKKYEVLSMIQCLCEEEGESYDNIVKETLRGYASRISKEIKGWRKLCKEELA